MKKIFTAMFVFALLFVLTGCSKPEKDLPEEPGVAQEIYQDDIEERKMEDVDKMMEEDDDKMEHEDAREEEDAEGVEGAEGESGFMTDSQIYTLKQVAEHGTPDDCWTVVDDEVADITLYFGKHPGGDDNLAKACGVDSTEMFESVKKHDPNGYKKLKEYVVGEFQTEDE